MLATRTRRTTMSALIFGLLAICVATAVHVRAANPSYELTWQTIVPGGTLDAQDVCFRLSGTMAQAVVDPGISAADTYSLFSGFWSAAPILGQDQLFFNAFEDCIP